MLRGEKRSRQRPGLQVAPASTTTQRGTGVNEGRLTSRKETVLGRPLVGGEDDALQRLEGLEAGLLADDGELGEHGLVDGLARAEVLQLRVRRADVEALLGDERLEVRLVREDDLLGWGSEGQRGGEGRGARPWACWRSSRRAGRCWRRTGSCVAMRDQSWLRRGKCGRTDLLYTDLRREMNREMTGSCEGDPGRHTRDARAQRTAHRVRVSAGPSPWSPRTADLSSSQLDEVLLAVDYTQCSVFVPLTNVCNASQSTLRSGRVESRAHLRSAASHPS